MPLWNAFLCPIAINMQTVLITGGTGMIGQALTKQLVSNGTNVIILTRSLSGKKPTEQVRYALWDVEKQTIDEHALLQADYIIHLAGANVAEERWTSKRKEEILNSRVKSGALLVKALNEMPNHVQAVISASAIGWYGPDTKEQYAFEETDQPANDFLGSVVQQWEAAIQPVVLAGKRLVVLRTGIVLSNDGGAWPELKKALRFRTAAIVGSGNQVVSWVHIDDLVRIYMEAIDNENFTGIYNAVAPAPVTNAEITKALVRSKNKKYFFAKVPAFVLKIVLGEMSVEVLKSSTVSAKRLLQNGFQFQYPTIEAAIRELEER